MSFVSISKKPVARERARGERGLAPPRRREEWLGGIFTAPAYVAGDPPFRPEMALWMTRDGLIVGCLALGQGDTVAAAVDSFVATTLAPAEGLPRLPSSIRVDSPALAEALRARLGPAVQVRVAAIPEMQPVLGHLREYLGQPDPGARPPTYLGGGRDPAAVGSLFRAAAGLYKAAPWRAVPSDTSILSLQLDELGSRELVVCVIGQLGQSYGVLLFSSPEGFMRHVELADTVAAGVRPVKGPRFLSLSFEPALELPDALRLEIAAHGWGVAGPDAYPWVSFVDEDLIAWPPTGAELSGAEAVARGLTRLVREHPSLERAWDPRGTPVEATYAVETHAGQRSVTLRAPHPAWQSMFR